MIFKQFNKKQLSAFKARGEGTTMGAPRLGLT